MPANQPHPVRAALADASIIPTLEDMLADLGSAGHVFVRQFSDSGAMSGETIADVLHHLGLLHGRRPSLFEIVAQSPLASAPAWLNAAMRNFAYERELLTRLMVAAGPPPSRIGQTRIEEAVNATRNAMVTLAGSDRQGCAIGAAAALLLDWGAISPVLRKIAQQLDVKVDVRHTEWPDLTETHMVIEDAASLPRGERAVIFGFQTLLTQHFNFWNIIQTRAG